MSLHKLLQSKYENWEQLPRIWGNYDSPNFIIDENTRAHAGFYPKFDESVNQGLTAGKLTMEDVSEVVMKYFESARSVMEEIQVYFKRKGKEEYLLVMAESRRMVNELIENSIRKDPDSLDYDLYKAMQPEIKYFDSLSEAKYESANFTEDIDHLPKQYFQ